MTKIYNRQENKTLRQKLCRQLTKGEIILWEHLQHNQLGYRFRRQHSIGKYVADFYCSKLKLIIEVDGYSHLNEEVFTKDQIRQQYLENLNLIILRYTSEEIFSNIKQVKKQIYYICRQLDIASATPPTPSW